MERARAKDRTGRRPGVPQLLLVAAFAGLTGVQAVRTAGVSAASSASDLAARAWPRHPRVLEAELLLEVAEAAGRRRPLGPSADALIERLSAADPLSPDPFLIEAARAEKAGRFSQSERLLIEARRRDPRAPAVRLLLAQAMLRRGETLRALEEMAILSRFVPGSFAPLTKALAAHAQSSAGVGELQQLLARRPDLEEPLLAALADDPANAVAILALASRSKGARPDGRKAPAWQPKLLIALVAQGRFDIAREAWLRITGETLQAAIYNPRFEPSLAPAPFNWTLAQSGGAVAEADQGRLHVVHFGRDDMAVAQQVLVLPAGRYRLSMGVTGEAPPGQLRWRVRCLPGGPEILDLPARPGGEGGRIAGDFTVPAAGCAGQRLELSGARQDFPADADVYFGGLKLEHAPS